MYAALLKTKKSKTENGNLEDDMGIKMVMTITKGYEIDILPSRYDNR